VGECKQEAESAYEMLETARAYGTGEIANQAVTVLRLLRKTEWQDARRAPQGQPPQSQPPMTASAMASLSPSSSSAYQTPSPSQSAPLTPPSSHSISEFHHDAALLPETQQQQPYDPTPGSAPVQATPLIPFLASSNAVPSHQRGYDSAYVTKPTPLSHDQYGGFAPPRVVNSSLGSAALTDSAYNNGYGSGGGGAYGYGSVDVGGGGGTGLDFGLMTFEMLQRVDVESLQWRGDWGHSFMMNPAAV